MKDNLSTKQGKETGGKLFDLFQKIAPGFLGIPPIRDLDNYLYMASAGIPFIMGLLFPRWLTIPGVLIGVAATGGSLFFNLPETVVKMATLATIGVFLGGGLGTIKESLHR